eukprot:5277116-Amphidinium_carterae.1
MDGESDVWLQWQDEEKSVQDQPAKIAGLLQPHVQQSAQSSSPRTQMAHISEDEGEESDIPIGRTERKRGRDSSESLSPTSWAERLLTVFGDIWAGAPKTKLTVATLCSGLGTPTMAMKVNKWKTPNFASCLALSL